jgi:hypothetical protein
MSESLGCHKTGGELLVVTRGPHCHHEWVIADPDFQGLFNNHIVIQRSGSSIRVKASHRAFYDSGCIEVLVHV